MRGDKLCSSVTERGDLGLDLEFSRNLYKSYSRQKKEIRKLSKVLVQYRSDVCHIFTMLSKCDWGVLVENRQCEVFWVNQRANDSLGEGLCSEYALLSQESAGESPASLLSAAVLTGWSGFCGQFEGKSIDRKVFFSIDEFVVSFFMNDCLSLPHDSDEKNIHSLPFLKNNLQSIVSRSLRNGGHFALLAIKLDTLQFIDEIVTHRGEAKVEKALMSHLSSCVRCSDIVCCHHLDLYFILLFDLKTQGDVYSVANKIIANMQRFVLQNQYFSIDSNVGAVYFDGDSGSPSFQEPDAFIYAADVALRNAKRRGEGNIELYSQEKHHVFDRQILAQKKLFQAIETSNFLLHYQLKVCVDDSRLVGVEALLGDVPARHQSGLSGDYLPQDPALNDYMDLAEKSGQILPLGQWILRQVCRDIAEFSGNYQLDGFRFTINLSKRQLEHKGFHKSVEKIVMQYQIRPRWLEFEISETDLASSNVVAAEELAALKRMGFKITLDHFGKTVGALGLLRRYDVDAVKIDASVVAGLLKASLDKLIVDSIVSVGEVLSVEVVAEGVEHQEQYLLLKSLGCDVVQGNFLSRPVVLAQLSRILMHPEYYNLRSISEVSRSA